MPRSPRLTLAGQAHHIIKRGNNRQAIFFTDADRRLFLDELAAASAAKVTLTPSLFAAKDLDQDVGIAGMLGHDGRGNRSGISPPAAPGAPAVRG